MSCALRWSTGYSRLHASSGFVIALQSFKLILTIIIPISRIELFSIHHGVRLTEALARNLAILVN